MSDYHHSSKNSWAIFDAPWYLKRYENVLTQEEKCYNQTQLEDLWKQKNLYLGHSPNRYFDEKYYILANHNVEKTIKQGGIFDSGFQHYCEIGYRHATPHWLFSEDEYFQKNDDISFRKITKENYKNGYDHFILKGDKERRKISLFFDHEIFIYSCYQENIPVSPDIGAFSQFLSLKNEKYISVRTSWYFDPKWYLNTYPEIETLIKNKHYISALHHYICNNNKNYNPNPYFQEEYYLNTYPNVKKDIEEGIFRNAYAHFIEKGISQYYNPHPDIDLKEFANDICNIQFTLTQEKVNDVYSLFIKYKENNVSYKKTDIQHHQIQNLLQKKIDSKLTSLFRAPLYFNNALPIKGARTEFTIIIISQGNYIYSLETLLSLYEQKTHFVEIIFISNGNNLEKDYISHCFKNIKFIFSHYHITAEELAKDALKEAHSDNILFLYAGCSLLPHTLKALSSSILHYNIHAAAPQIINMNGDIKEASSIILRDGNIHPYGENNRPYSHEVSSIKDVNCFNHSGFYAKKVILEKIWDKVLSCGLNNDFLSVSISLKEIEEKIFYIPEFIIKDARINDISSSLKERMKEKLRYYFPNFISRQTIPHQRNSLITNRSAKANILFICNKIPLHQNVSSERRFLSLINIFKKMGWQVTVISLTTQHNIINENLGVILEYPREIEFLIGEEYLYKFSSYHVINITWIIGTQTFQKISNFIIEDENKISSSILVLDTVDLDGKGLRSTEKYLTHVINNNIKTEELLKDTKEELSSAWICHSILALNEEEKNIIKNVGLGVVTTLPAYLPNEFINKRPLKNFNSREGLLFSLPIYEEDDTHHDALKWLCLHIIPFLRKALEQDIPIWIANKIQGSIDISFYERYSQIEMRHEAITYEELLQKCRILIIPSRKMTLYPLEILEAAEYSLPAIIGESFCHSLNFKEGEEIISGGMNDPKLFAEKIAHLYTNADLWNLLSKNIHKNVRENYHQENYEKKLSEFLTRLKTGRGETYKKYNLKAELKPAPLKMRFKNEPIIKEEKEEKEMVFLEEDDINENEDFIPKTRLGVSL